MRTHALTCATRLPPPPTDLQRPAINIGGPFFCGRSVSMSPPLAFFAQRHSHGPPAAPGSRQYVPEGVEGKERRSQLLPFSSPVQRPDRSNKCQVEAEEKARMAGYCGFSHCFHVLPLWTRAMGSSAIIHSPIMAPQLFTQLIQEAKSEESIPERMVKPSVAPPPSYDEVTNPNGSLPFPSLVPLYHPEK